MKALTLIGGTVMKPAQRITIQRGKQKRRFVIVKAPFAEVGDTVKLDGEEWRCIRVELTEALSITFPKRKTGGSS